MKRLNKKQKAFAVLYTRGESAEKAYFFVYGKDKKFPLSDADCCDHAARLLKSDEIQEYMKSIETLFYSRSTSDILRRIFMEIACSHEVTVSERLKAADGLSRLDGEKGNGAVTLHLEGMEKFLG